MSTQQIKFALDALNTSVSTQVRNIKNDVLHFDKYKVNYDAILELPMVKELLIENKKLRSKNRKLEKRLLSVLLDKHNAVKQSEPISSTDDELVIIEHVKDNIVYEIVEDGMELEECSTAFTNVKIKEEVVEEEEEEEEVVEEVVEEEEEVVEEEVVEEEEEEQEEEQEEEEVVEEEVVEEEEEVVEEEEQEEEEQEEVVIESDSVEIVEEEDDSGEVYEVLINGKTFYVTNEKDSIIYDLDENGDISIEAGVYKNGKPVFKK